MKTEYNLWCIKAQCRSETPRCNFHDLQYMDTNKIVWETEALERTACFEGSHRATTGRITHFCRMLLQFNLQLLTSSEINK